MSSSRQLRLGAFMRPVSIHTAAWRYPGAWPDANFNFKRLTRLAQTLERGKSSGGFSFADARITRLALLEMCNGVARWYSDRGPRHPAEIADCFADLALAMVGARPDGPGAQDAEKRGLPTREILALIDAELQGGTGDRSAGGAAQQPVASH